MALDEAALVADLRSRLFAPPSTPVRDSRAIGAELEMIPLLSSNHAPAPIAATKEPSTVESVRGAARARGWIEDLAESGAPEWNLPDGSRLSFEPGGQLEISSRPHETCSTLIDSLRATVDVLIDAASHAEIQLLFAGVDPYNEISAVPLQLHSDRYVRMTRYFEARGESGVRMMRQTAALQISVERGQRPAARWKLLCALAPYVITLFGNSQWYAGRDTGRASYRAYLWRTLDKSRTGVPFDERNPSDAYARFALDAGAIRAGGSKGEFHSFRSLLPLRETSREDWQFHLSTLFPEVRPKEHFEIRSADTIHPDYLAAPLAFVAGLIYDAESEARAEEILGDPQPELLEPAGDLGLADKEIRARASELVRVALDGASRLGDAYLRPSHLDEAAIWFSERLAGD